MIVCTWILLRTRNVSDKSRKENQNTHLRFNNFFFFENPTIYDIMGKNIEEPGRPLTTIWRMRIACWITKATYMHSEYVIFIVFLLQQLLDKCASMLRYTSIACLVTFNILLSYEPEDHPCL